MCSRTGRPHELVLGQFGDGDDTEGQAHKEAREGLTAGSSDESSEERPMTKTKTKSLRRLLRSGGEKRLSKTTTAAARPRYVALY